MIDGRLHSVTLKSPDREAAKSWCRWAGETGGSVTESERPVPAPDPVSKAIDDLRICIIDLTEFLYRDDRVRAGARAGDALRVIKADYEKRAAAPRPAQANEAVTQAMVELVRKMAARSECRLALCQECGVWAQDDASEARRLVRMAGPA